MNVMFVSSDNKRTSGAFLCMVDLCKNLRDDYGINTYVILPFNGSGQELLEENDIPYRVIFSFTWLVVKSKRNSLFQRMKRCVARTYNVIAIQMIRKFIRKHHIDIVHINTTCSYVGAKAAKKENVKLIWHIREFLEEHSDLTLWNRKKNNLLIASSDQVITISECLSKKYVSIVPKDKLTVVYDGIDVSLFSNRNDILSGTCAHFIFVGALYKDKGIEDLLRACSMIAGKVTFTLDIVGQGELQYEQMLQELVKELRLDEQVSFLGVRNDVNKLLETADIAFTCSRAEAFGRVTVEAMMAGCLVIGTNAAATAEIIKDKENGLLYEYGNVAQLSEKISYAISNKDEMRKLAKKGCAEARKLYSLKKNVDGVFELYHKLCVK